MRLSGRNLVVYSAVALLLAAVGWAFSFERFPPADFTFANETEIQSVDPAVVRGQPEGRIVTALFEGLYQDDPRTLDPVPGIASRLPDISPDGKVYTIELRRNALWSDGSRVTAHDFHWSWQRFLHPATASIYAYQLWYIVGAQKYNSGDLADGDPVEVELPKSDRQDQPFPRGEMLYGKLTSITKGPEPSPAADTSEAEKKRRDNAVKEWKKGWIFNVVAGDRRRRFSAGTESLDAGVEPCRIVLYDFRQVGIDVVDDYKLRLTLANKTPFFTHLLAFYPLRPVHRGCVEKHGIPNWTKPENLVCNGPYTMKFRRIRDRIRLVKNPLYWDAANVRIETIDALAVQSRTTAMNMYLNGQVDWVTSAPDTVIPELVGREDFSCQPMLTTYFYRLNVTRKPLDDLRVRRALNMAIDKRQICESFMKGGQQPARSLVPPGLAGYESALGDPFDVEGARKLLAEAGYPGGKGMPTFDILYNVDERHERLAELIQGYWKTHLGVDARLMKMEWGVYLDTIHKMDYTVSRNAWTGDYPDPNTFLDMFVTGGENNETGWSNADYDRLIREAAAIVDPQARMARLHDAEAILVREVPIVPFYFYVSKNMVRPYVSGFHANILDQHPLHRMSVDPDEKRRVLGAEGLR